MFSQAVRLLAFDRATAGRYAEIRRNRSIRSLDAIQLACAAQVGVDLFITNDERLSRLTSPVSSSSRRWIARTCDRPGGSDHPDR